MPQNLIRQIKIVISKKTLGALLLLLVSLNFAPAATMAAGLCREALSPQISLLQTNDFESDPLNLSLAKELKELTRTVNELERDPSVDLENPRFNQILSKALFDPNSSLNTEELSFLAKNRAHLQIVRSAQGLAQVGRKTLNVIRATILYWEGHLSVTTFHTEKTWKLKALRLIQATYNGPLRFLVPFVTLPRFDNPIDIIFRKKYLDPKFQPSPDEIQTLHNYGAYKTFVINEEFQKSAPKWSTFRRWLGRAYIAALALNSAMVANWALHLSEPQALVPAPTFVAEPQYRLREHQVRIYNESVPFPHMAIEIDGKVYSYGQEHMSIKSAREYLFEDQIREMVTRKDNKKTFDGSFTLSSLIEKTGINKLPRSVQMVTMNLDPGQRASLKRFLELSEHSAYRNQTLVMDCSTMITLALAHNTTAPLPLVQGYGLDASPSSMMMYYGALKTAGVKNIAGQNLIGDIKQIAVDEPNRPQLHLWRNLYINAMEGKVFYVFLSLNVPMRTYLNIRYGEKDFQYLEPEVKAELLSWQKAVFTEISDANSQEPLNVQLQVMINEGQNLSKIPKAQRDQDWQKRFDTLSTAANFYLGRLMQNEKEIGESADTAFADLIRSNYRYHVLMGYKTYFNSDLSNPSIQIGNADQILNEILGSKYVKNWH